MGVILVTGATGFVGSRLVRELGTEHDVIALSRRPTNLALSQGAAAADHVVVRGDFTSREELAALDAHEIDTVVHLASEIGGCSEEAGLAVNVLGTRTLLRYLIERGCRHFVIASSVAAVGCLSEGFVPRELPIPDDHPCDAVDAYGLSKALMEEVAFYLHRQEPELLEIALLRLGAVLRDENPSIASRPLAETTLPFVVGGGVIAHSDAVAAFAHAVGRRLGPGVRRFNLVGRESRTSVPVPEALRAALGADAVERLDTSWYDQPGHETASLYAVDRLQELYGFRHAIDVRTVNPPLVADTATPEAS